MARTGPEARFNYVISVVSGLLAFVTASPASAALINCITGEHTTTVVTAACGWDQTKAAAGSGNLGGPEWRVSATDSGRPPIDLTFNLQHLADPDGTAGLPGPAVTLRSGSIPAGSRGAGAGLVAHNSLNMGRAVTGTDLYRYRAGPDAAGAMSVEVLGRHVSTAPAFEWSFIPPAVAGNLQVSESRANGTVSRPVATGSIVTNGGRVVIVGAPLPRKLRGTEERVSGTLTPGSTDYTIRYTVGDPFFSDTTLSFVTGSPGSFEEADLGLMTAFFVGNADFLVPDLFEANSFAGSSMQDLFITVDLTQWLSFGEDFTAGTSLHITNGMSDDLPGFLIATSNGGNPPITFDPAVGYTALPGSLFTGDVVIGGTIDGQAVPEPGTLGLLFAGALLLLGLRRMSRPKAVTLSLACRFASRLIPVRTIGG